jgi:phage gp36-like protein
MAYISLTDLYNYVDKPQVQAFSDDYATGTIDMTIINNICQLASDKADSLVSSMYNVPFTGLIPVKIRTAAIIFAVEMLYARRLTPDQKNPMKSEADHWREELMMINSGQLSLDYQSQRAFTPIVFSSTLNKVDSNIF